MSTFSIGNFDTEHYCRSRPSYPTELYKLINDYHKGTHEVLVDVGCGPGIATFQLAKELGSFEMMYGTDISPRMIQVAKSQNMYGERLKFVVAPCYNFDFIEPHDKIDMITAAECAHWFDFNRFQTISAQKLRKNGTLAIWGYVDPIFIDFPHLDQANTDFLCAEDQLGSYWQQPGRSILRDTLKNTPLDPELYGDIREKTIDPRWLRDTAKLGRDKSTKQSIVCKKMTLQEYKDYLKSSSAYHSWKQDATNKNKTDICDAFIRELCHQEPTLGSISTFRVAWLTFYKIGRRL
ncbi:hypothetical protein KAFR_0B02610 [Kazachstania africana CBS 2517]|uniref:Methyltransferase domain-containing protein n=1 Tax=Kazachstania africana (strain ATCC 22294 / BCRC 22015 / CBS 2517 / CECT 1963 / NBRC 1671 / NRRL Y-8276) TaxID=1071382 RepID=H2AQA8_KAZAF|nr:hypothetical protein KAFR_0B02610 [Kazachstania africana CBS 2517]CCF56558.1 hypothetical protein KAFR_0B02610 [Kazachstania africana CBS 2517]